MFDRFILQIGEENFKKIQNTNIVILGIGGVGGYTFESLIRSGIKNITIIDNDKIDITNLNRQIISTNSNLGHKKVKEAKIRGLNINKDANIKEADNFIDESNIEEIFKEKIDYFVDACDTINTKKLVIDYCLKNNIKLITCMGTGNKLDPEKLKICDIRKTNNDPVARILRKHIKDKNYKDKIMTISSDEVPLKKGKVISSNSFVPASAGLLITSYIINDIIKKN